MHQLEARIQRNIRLTDSFWHLVLEAPAIATEAQPGQFVMVRLGREFDPLLRRPFSLYRLRPEEGLVEIVYKIVGRGTKMLTEYAPGAFLDLVGPLGHGFTLLPKTRAIGLVGRGIGIAPLVALAEQAARAGLKIWAFLSARQSSLLVGRDLLEALGARLYLQTDDGSFMGPGLVTDYLGEVLRGERLDQLFTCGSLRLARAVAMYARDYGIPAQVSLEARMACGLGACLGCAVEIVTERGRGPRVYQRVCTEGPVFWVEEVAAING